MLAHILATLNYSVIPIHKGLNQVERMSRYNEFMMSEKRILVTTNLLGRGINVQRVNLAINYDTPETSDGYLHRVTRAGRFGTEAKVLSFVSSEKDANMLTNVQEQFDVEIKKIERNSSHLCCNRMNIPKMENNHLQIPSEHEKEEMGRAESIIWAEDRMDRLCNDFEHAVFLK